MVPITELYRAIRLSSLLLFLSFSIYTNQCLLVSSRYARISRRISVRHVIKWMTVVCGLTSGALVVYYFVVFSLGEDWYTRIYGMDLMYVAGVWGVVGFLFLGAGVSLIKQLKVLMKAGTQSLDSPGYDYSPSINHLSLSLSHTHTHTPLTPAQL
ncbi:hypothetical protein KIPB_010534 [Kipferlia bialata]|uniref:Uncharacterized protein n=1 Tax=Kipferlia bialata TaxID=797122 RepID=A0A9K3D6Q2_9EUKA|nr:hypothetical protein KIPB_010534 [Kipferlia bialata]|eukprot:g10534.t1